MASKKVKIDKVLYDKAQQYSESAGYATLDEFITHILEKELAKIETGDDSVEEVEKRLRGLGYIA